MRIETHRCTLRDWERSDAASLARHADNPRVAATMKDSFPSPCTLKDARLFIHLVRRNPRGLFLAIDVSGEAIGGIAVHPHGDVRRRTADIGYWVSESFWGKGIATSAVQAIIPVAFEKFDLARIQAGIFSNNPASMKVLEKCGFTREAILSRAFTKNGLLLDEVVYALIRSEQGNSSDIRKPGP